MYAPFLHDVVYLYDEVYLHDVVYLYAVIVDEMIQLGLNYRNGTDVMHRAKNFQFNGTGPKFHLREQFPRSLLAACR